MPDFDGKLTASGFVVITGDDAGNVLEWLCGLCIRPGNQRLVLGGAWSGALIPAV